MHQFPHFEPDIAMHMSEDTTLVCKQTEKGKKKERKKNY
uniref:Uncharacterized protein n=1 Tax=Anguilla anguilla TaxID=7936 RepID=A0A0E9PU74_ANGAN